VWNAVDLAGAEAELARIVAAYADSAPKLAQWLERDVSEGLAVFSLPEAHRCRMRTANPIERAIQQELKRRTRKIRVFPNEASLERLATAILVEIDEQWIAADRAYLTMENRDG
jgi:putative transposase